jgi:hypothetical protein
MGVDSRFKPLGIEEGAKTGQSDGFEMFMVRGQPVLPNAPVN